MLDETECSMPRNTLFSSTKQKSRNKIFSVTAFLILCLSKRLLFYLLQFQGFSCLKKSLPLSSTKMNAGKFSTSIFQIASIPSSGYSTHSMLLMLFCAKIAAGPPGPKSGAACRRQTVERGGDAGCLKIVTFAFAKQRTPRRGVQAKKRSCASKMERPRPGRSCLRSRTSR